MKNLCIKPAFLVGLLVCGAVPTRIYTACPIRE